MVKALPTKKREPKKFSLVDQVGLEICRASARLTDRVFAVGVAGANEF